jgi:hypothetical protein
VKANSIFVAAFCIVLVHAVEGRPVLAQDQPSPGTFSTLKEWKTTDEITFGAAIREIVSKNPTGAPAGLTLLTTGSQGVLYISLGPNLGDALTRSLSPGQDIQVVGLVQTLNGQNYLLARQLVIGNQTIDLRNKRGFLTHPSTAPGPRAAAHPQSEFGGAR